MKNVTTFIDQVEEAHKRLIVQINSLDTFTKIIKNGVEEYFEENKPESEKSMNLVEKETKEAFEIAIRENNVALIKLKKDITKKLKGSDKILLNHPIYTEYKSHKERVNAFAFEVLYAHSLNIYKNEFYRNIQYNIEYFYLSSLASLWTKLEMYLGTLVEITEISLKIQESKRRKEHSNWNYYLGWLKTYGVKTEIEDEKLRIKFDKVKSSRNSFIHSLTTEEKIPSLLEMQDSQWLDDSSDEPDEEPDKLKDLYISENDLYSNASKTIRDYAEFIKANVTSAIKKHKKS